VSLKLCIVLKFWPARARISAEVWINMANQIGKRYVCKKCGSEFIVTKAGDGTLSCCGEPMELKK